MSLTEMEQERLDEILQALEPELKTLSPKAQGFVRDIIDRHDQYGADTYVSAKQWDWLEKLYVAVTEEE